MFHRLVVVAFEPFTIVHANSVFADMLGYSVAKLHGKCTQDLVEDSRQMAQILKACAANKIPSKPGTLIFKRPSQYRHLLPLTCTVVVRPLPLKQDTPHFVIEVKPSRVYQSSVQVYG